MSHCTAATDAGEFSWALTLPGITSICRYGCALSWRTRHRGWCRLVIEEWWCMLAWCDTKILVWQMQPKQNRSIEWEYERWDLGNITRKDNRLQNNLFIIFQYLCKWLISYLSQWHNVSSWFLQIHHFMNVHMLTVKSFGPCWRWQYPTVLPTISLEYS